MIAFSNMARRSFLPLIPSFDMIICLTLAWMMFDIAMAALHTTIPVGTVIRSKG
jgi:hypothetical protein